MHIEFDDIVRDVRHPYKLVNMKILANLTINRNYCYLTFSNYTESACNWHIKSLFMPVRERNRSILFNYTASKRAEYVRCLEDS